MEIFSLIIFFYKTFGNILINITKNNGKTDVKEHQNRPTELCFLNEYKSENIEKHVNIIFNGYSKFSSVKIDKQSKNNEYIKLALLK